MGDTAKSVDDKCVMDTCKYPTQRKDMLELILAAREDGEEFAKTPHQGKENTTKGLYDDDIVAHITHFFLAGKVQQMCDVCL